MKTSNKIISLAVALTLVLTAGCSKKSSTSSTIKNTVIEKSSLNEYKIKTIEFDLGNKIYKSSNNKEMPYRLGGIMSIPQGDGKFPIVLIAHGSYQNEKEGYRFDTGFKYLTEELAKNGYIAISMDVQNAYLWKFGDNDDAKKITYITDEHIESLKKANAGEIEGYGINLKNKLDFENLALIGHSRGGGTIFEIAQEQSNKNQSISALLSIAPTEPNIEYSDIDINTSILVPEYDGDVVDLSGFYIYDKLTSKKREHFVQLTMLEKANHNYFNNNISFNDSELLGRDVSDQLSKKQQQEFLANYTVDFLNSAIKNENKNSVYDTKITSPIKMYGCEVKTLFSDKNTVDIASVENVDKFTSEGVTMESTQDSWFFKNDKAQGIKTLTSGYEDLSIRNLINIKWDKINGKISFIPSIKDFSNFNSLSMNVLQDPSSNLNKDAKNQAFTIEIKDKNGNVSRVELDKSVSSLDYISGKLLQLEIEGKNYNDWSVETPLTELRVPLNTFTNIDLSNINEVSLLFDKTDSGSIMISKFELK